MNVAPAPRTASRLRCLLVGVAAIAAFATLVRLLAPGLAPLPAGQRFDEQLVWCCTVVALAGSAWLCVLATVVAAEAARGSASPTLPGVPALVRRLVLGACGVALVGGLGAPAASASTAAREDPPHHLSPVVLAGLPLPDRAAGTGGVVGTAGAGAMVGRAGTEVVVRAGDTLWARARRSLPPGADDAAITVRWHRIYALNRDRDRPGPRPDPARASDCVCPATLTREPPCHRSTSGSSRCGRRRPLASVQGTLALDLQPRHDPPGRARPARPARRRRHPDRPARAPPGRAVVPPLRPGRRRDRRRRPAGLPAAAVVEPERVRRPAAPRPARRPGRRAPPGQGRVQPVRPQVVGVRTCFLSRRVVEVSVHVRYGARSRALAARFELRAGRGSAPPWSSPEPGPRRARAAAASLSR